MKHLLTIFAVFILLISTSKCQPVDSTIVINIIVDSTYNLCSDDTIRIHYIFNIIPSDTACNPIIIQDTVRNASLWYGWDIDEELLSVRMPDGNFPKREDGSYYYINQDSEGNLIPKRKIKYWYGGKLMEYEIDCN